MPGATKIKDPSVFTTPPTHLGEKKPGQLNDQQTKQYFDEGFIIVENLFDHKLLDEVREAISKLVDDLAHKLYDAGKVKSLYKEEGLFQRLTKLDNDFPGANIILHKNGKLPKAFRDLWSNDKILNIAEQILGMADIVGNPVWNLRCKTPNTEAAIVPWHQDSAYMDDESYNHHIFSAWIPFLDTDERNGGMQMIRGGHQAGTIAEHQCCWGGTWYIMLEEEEMAKTLGCDVKANAVTCKVPYGGAILFNNIIPHRSLENSSNDIRWAMDLRFQRLGTPAGLWGLKEVVQLRSSTDPKMQIDWETFESVSRTDKQFEAMDTQNDEFDTTIHGPWMKRWNIVHMNRHTVADVPEGHLPEVIG